MPGHENATSLIAEVEGPGLHSVNCVLLGLGGAAAKIDAQGDSASLSRSVSVRADRSCGASRPKPCCIRVYAHNELTIITADHKYSTENNALGSQL